MTTKQLVASLRKTTMRLARRLSKKPNAKLRRLIREYRTLMIELFATEIESRHA